MVMKCFDNVSEEKWGRAIYYLQDY